ncbi:MAG: RHS repeat-associated core domain-containing protein [Bacteroidota bacterium]
MNLYRYNGKEWEESIGLYDYGARYYDPAIARWGQVDPLADHPNQVDKSPYAYAWNNPILLNDPDGQCPNCGTAVAGAIIGGLIGGGIELGRQLYNDGQVSNWQAVKGNTVSGAITGAAVGFTGGTSLVATTTVAGVSNAVGETASRNIQGQETTATDLAVDATIGAVSGVAGAAGGKMVEGAMDALSPATKGKIGEAVTEIKYGAQGYRSTGKSNVPTGGTTPTGRRQVARYDHDMKNVVTGSRRTVESKFNRARLTGNQRAARGNISTPGGLIVDRTTSGQFGNLSSVSIITTATQVFNGKY